MQKIGEIVQMIVTMIDKKYSIGQRIVMMIGEIAQKTVSMKNKTVQMIVAMKNETVQKTVMMTDKIGETVQ